MFRPRVIPILFLKKSGLVKSIKFKDYQYIGDPINAVKIFNDLFADELVFLDITATQENRCIPIEFVKSVGDEANMAFAVGGGIKSLFDINNIINAGSEKIIINSEAINNSNLISDAAKEFGSSTIVVSIDVKKRLFKGQQVYINGGSKSTGIAPLLYAKMMEENGAGEILVNSIDLDGMMPGYDIKLIESISKEVKVPVIASGGAGTFEDFKRVVIEGHASAVAAGSMFVYHGPRKAVLLSYPSVGELNLLSYENLNRHQSPSSRSLF